MAEALRYKDKITIVTGGSKGIGRGCVEVFVQHGSKVVFCSRGEKDGLALEAEMNAKGPGTAMFVQCDMTKEEDIKNLVNKTVEAYGQIDCVINNAGTHPPVIKIDDISGEDFRKLLDYNLVSYFLVAKGGITSLSKALAIDEAEHGVRVNTLSPGNIWTPLWEACAKQTPDFEKCVKAGEDSQLLGRFGTIEECGNACLFLAADATFCTGIKLLMSGGAELSYGLKNPKAKKSDNFV